MAEEILQIVDANDQPIGGATREELKTRDLKYRVIRISVEDRGNILLQKRTANIDTYPNCWDNSAAGRVDEGEDYIDAARRELYEEIGLKDTSLEEILYFYSEVVEPGGNKMNQFTKVYRAIIDSAKFKPILQESEVSQVRWVTIQDLREIVSEGAVTNGLLQTYERYYKGRND